MDFDVEYAYACGPERLHETLTDRAHVEAKLAATGGGEIVEIGPYRIETTREIAAPLPGFAAKLFGDTQHVRQVEEWTAPTPAEPAFVGTFTGTAAGTPVVVTGTLRIHPAADSCSLRIRGQVEAKVPFVGGKIAELVREQVVKNLDREHAFTATWLTEH